MFKKKKGLEPRGLITSINSSLGIRKSFKETISQSLSNSRKRDNILSRTNQVTMGKLKLLIRRRTLVAATSVGKEAII